MPESDEQLSQTLDAPLTDYPQKKRYRLANQELKSSHDRDRNLKTNDAAAAAVKKESEGPFQETDAATSNHEDRDQD